MPFVHTAGRYRETRHAALIREGHKAGRGIGCCHIRLAHETQKGRGPSAPARPPSAAQPLSLRGDPFHPYFAVAALAPIQTRAPMPTKGIATM